MQCTEENFFKRTGIGLHLKKKKEEACERKKVVLFHRNQKAKIQLQVLPCFNL